MAKLFQPFTGLSPHLPPDQRGTCPGLFISKRFVERHGGRMWAESEGAGRGATIGFALPLAAPAAPPA